MYVVVEFLEEEGVEVILLRWLIENEKECYWLQFKNIYKIILLIKVVIVLIKDFKMFFVRVFRKFSKYIFKLVYVIGKF